MKNNQYTGFVVPILLAVIALIVIGGLYMYESKKTEAPALSADISVSADVQPSNQAQQNNLNSVRLSDGVFMAAVGENATKVRARGDIDGDGFEDAIVEEIHCGAGCSVGLEIVFNQKNTSAKLFNPPQYANFEPSYSGSSAIKSNVTNITISNGLISLTGEGLACGDPNVYCQDEEWHKVRTVTYKFDGTKIMQLSVNPPLEIKGTYEFSEFAAGTGGANQTWVYKLYLKNEEGVGDIRVNVDGFQTMTNMYAKGVKSSAGLLDVVFDSYGQDNTFTSYKKGDVLFTLKPTYYGLSIEWKKMQPNLDRSISGSFFVRTFTSN